MTKRGHILVLSLALLAMICLPGTIAAQARRIVVDSIGLAKQPRFAVENLGSLEFLDSLGNVERWDSVGFSENYDTTDTKFSQGRKKIIRGAKNERLTSFVPDPSKATWCALVFPGGGQIYNHKYWKLPIVYGGFLGCAYALNWNNQMYSDYSQAYLDIMDDDPGTASYEDFLPPRYNVEANKDYLTRVFKNRKDNYRRQRDISIFSFIGVYLLSVIDAYVDAELSDFDITDDLTVRIRPTTIDNRQQTLRDQTYGLMCSFSF